MSVRSLRSTRARARPDRTGRTVRQLADDRGFTMPELIAAMLIFALGAIALISSLDTSRRVGSNAERRGEAVTIAEREIASIVSRAYGAVALTGVPAEDTSSSNNPAYYVTRVGSAPSLNSWYRWDQPGLGTQNPPPRCSPAGAPSGDCSQFVVDAGGVSPTPTIETVQLAQGQVGRYETHRFVTWADDPSTAGCTQDYKRVTVAVRVVKAGGGPLELGPKTPTRVSTLVSNPNAGLLGCG
jgi:prepilin-type N-terminal cleavage/methylation domain-containing protein